MLGSSASSPLLGEKAEDAYDVAEDEDDMDPERDDVDWPQFDKSVASRRLQKAAQWPHTCSRGSELRR